MFAVIVRNYLLGLNSTTTKWGRPAWDFGRSATAFSWTLQIFPDVGDVGNFLKHVGKGREA